MSTTKESMDSDDVQFIKFENNIKKNKFSRQKSILKSPRHLISKKMESGVQASRRKATHKVINTEDEMFFESYPKLPDLSANKGNNTSSIRHKIAMQKLSEEFKNNEERKKSELSTSKLEQPDMENVSNHPAIEHMHRIAFLRACINYMLKSVGKEAIDFEETGSTLSKLVNKYNAISPGDDEVIGISD